MNEVELETLVGKLEGDGSSYQHMLDQAQHSVDACAEHVDSASKRIEGFGKNMRGFTEKAIAAVEVFGAGHWFKEAFEQYEEAEAVGIRLNAVLEVNGRDVEKLKAEYTEYAEQLQETTTLEDDHILKLFQKAEGFRVTGDAAKRAVRDAAGLAAYTGQSEEAMLRLSAAMARGDVKGAMRFARLVPELRGIKNASEFAQQYEKLVQTGMKVSGELAETAGGRIKQLRVAWGNLLEVLGEAVSTVITPVLTGLREFTKWFGNLDKATQVVLLALPALIALLATLPFIFGAISTIAAPFLAILMNPVFLIAAAGVGVLVYQLGGFAKTWELVKTAALSAWDWIKRKTNEFVTWVYPIWQAVDSLFSKGWGYIKMYASQAWEWVKKEWAEVESFFADLWSVVSDNTEVTWKEIQEYIQNGFLVAEFALDHFSEIMELAWTTAQFGAEAFRADMEYLFTTTIPTYLDWFADHWKEVLYGVWNFQNEVMQNLVENLVNVFSNLDDLISGKVSLGDIWKPLQTSLEKTLSTLPEIADRPVTDLERSLIGKMQDQAGALIDKFRDFRDDKLKEFATPDWEVDVGEAEKAGEDLGKSFSEGADKGLGKVDAAIANSVEGLSRFLDYKDKLDKKNENITDSGKGGGKAEAVKFNSGEARAKDKEQTDIFKQMRDGINKLVDKPAVEFEGADL